MTIKDKDRLRLPFSAIVERVEELDRHHKLFTINVEGHPMNYKPGQFVMVGLPGIGEAPISITSSPLSGSKSFELCIRSVGRLTEALHSTEAGSKVTVRGPFGNGFEMERFRGKDVLIVAAGLGLAPLRSLIDTIRTDKREYGNVVLLIGARNPASLLYKDLIEKWRSEGKIDVRVTVDVAEASWNDHVGVITTLFKEELYIDPKEAVAAVVGPPVVYRFVIDELLRLGLFETNIYLSLERRMRCGLGKCGHCQINGLYLCQDGPVLSYHDVLKLREAI